MKEEGRGVAAASAVGRRERRFGCRGGGGSGVLFFASTFALAGTSDSGGEGGVAISDTTDTSSSPNFDGGVDAVGE